MNYRGEYLGDDLGIERKQLCSNVRPTNKSFGTGVVSYYNESHSCIGYFMPFIT